MAKIHTQEYGRLYQPYPTTVAIVTVRAGDRANVMAAAWHAPLSYEPPLYGVAVRPEHYTHQLMLEAGEFALNFLPYQKIDSIIAVGRHSGQTMDKFAAFGLETEPARLITAPLLKDAYASFECRLNTGYPCGDHEWVVGQIVMAHLWEDLLTEEGVIRLDRASPALYMGANQFVHPDPQSLRRVSVPQPAQSRQSEA